MKKARTRDPEATRRKIVEATIGLMLKQGYSATTVDQICAESGMTKGSFFHHFESKEAVAAAAIEAWGLMGTSLYEEAWKDEKGDPLEQFHKMLDIMSGFTTRPDEPCVCMVGMMSQELAQTHPLVREACENELNVWTRNVAKMLANAKELHTPEADFDSEAVAWFLNSLWQGSMLVGKVRQQPATIRQNIELARAYVTSLFK